jgi:hypothetical protein
MQRGDYSICSGRACKIFSPFPIPSFNFQRSNLTPGTTRRALHATPGATGVDPELGSSRYLSMYGVSISLLCPSRGYAA